jgi:hypothetical protein
MMTTLCRLVIQDNKIPEIRSEVKDGFLIIKGPIDAVISDSTELCQYLRCRKRVTMGAKGQTLKFCHEHNEYLKRKQRENYYHHKLKNNSGLCQVSGCPEPRGPLKFNPNKLGQCCIKHAQEKNHSVQSSNKRRKLNV